MNLEAESYDQRKNWIFKIFDERLDCVSTYTQVYKVPSLNFFSFFQ